MLNKRRAFCYWTITIANGISLLVKGFYRLRFDIAFGRASGSVGPLSQRAVCGSIREQIKIQIVVQRIASAGDLVESDAAASIGRMGCYITTTLQQTPLYGMQATRQPSSGHPGICCVWFMRSIKSNKIFKPQLKIPDFFFFLQRSVNTKPSSYISQTFIYWPMKIVLKIIFRTLIGQIGCVMHLA